VLSYQFHRHVGHHHHHHHHHQHLLLLRQSLCTIKDVCNKETTKETIERHENEIDKLVSLLNYAFIDKLLFNFRKDVYAIKQINEFKNNVTQDVFPIMAQLFNSLNINYTQNHTLTFIDSMLKIEINRKLSLISDIKQLLDTCDISDKGNTIFELDKIQNSLLKIKI
jgi:hypothetical protein